MEFRTKIPIKPQEPKIGYESAILLLGSCFVENIGKKLQYSKFQSLLNPFGILFHPAAIAGFLEKVRSRHTYSEDDIFQHNERWHSFDAHSVLSDPDKDKMLQNLNAVVEDTRLFLTKATHVIITPGTAWAYDLLTTGETVTNCHKLPQKHFKKELKDVNQDLAKCVEIIHSINPKVSIIFTVSPVRHLKDGFIENQRSKSKLITAIHELLEFSPEGSGGYLGYFPSYEIMMDELRDYRFYAEDMVHPNDTAVSYIWKRFTETYMTEGTFSTLKEVDTIQKGLAHRPFNKNSEAHQKFLTNLRARIQDLKFRFPHIEF